MAASTENQAADEIKLKIITNLGQRSQLLIEQEQSPTVSWKKLKKCPDVFFVFVKENVFCTVKIWRSLDFVV